jgi:hypothetical protein
MGLADAADENAVALFGDELTTGEIMDKGLVDGCSGDGEVGDMLWRAAA